MRGDGADFCRPESACAPHRYNGTVPEINTRKYSSVPDDKAPEEERLDAQFGPVSYERYVQIATLRAGCVLSSAELGIGWSLLPAQLASQQGVAPASLRPGRPLPARGREELGPYKNALPAYESSRVDLSSRHGQSSLEYPQFEIGINQTVTHERQRQERGGWN